MNGGEPFVHRHSFYSPVQLIIRFFGLRFSYPLSASLFLPLLLSLIGKWILTWHNLLIFYKNKTKTSHNPSYFVFIDTILYFCNQNYQLWHP